MPVSSSFLLSTTSKIYTIWVRTYRYCRCSNFPSSGTRWPDKFKLPRSLLEEVSNQKLGKMSYSEIERDTQYKHTIQRFSTDYVYVLDFCKYLYVFMISVLSMEFSFESSYHINGREKDISNQNPTEILTERMKALVNLWWIEMVQIIQQYFQVLVIHTLSI